MKKICIVVQRYGVDANGGAEQHARRIAERLHLQNKYKVEIITSTARDANWENYYPAGETYVNDILVTRFPIIGKRNHTNWRIQQNIQQIAAERGRRVAALEIDNWLDAHGFVVPQLVAYLREKYDETSMFLFVTYLFYHTIKGLPAVKNKAVFLPTAHDEPFLYYPFYQDVFMSPRYFMFNSMEECNLIHRLFNNSHIPYKVIGEGVDTPDQVFPMSFKERWGAEDYILYVGRVGGAKQCDILMKYFTEYKNRNHGNLKLIFVGRSTLPESERDDVIFTGYLTDQEKFDAMAGAYSLVMPSNYESLCMAVLEALSVGTPVIVNGNCEVTKGHCLRSNAGLYYSNYMEFEACLDFMLNDVAIRNQMGENGKKYIEENYNWDLTFDYIDEIMMEA